MKKFLSKFPIPSTITWKTVLPYLIWMVVIGGILRPLARHQLKTIHESLIALEQGVLDGSTFFYGILDWVPPEAISHLFFKWWTVDLLFYASWMVGLLWIASFLLEQYKRKPTKGFLWVFLVPIILKITQLIFLTQLVHSYPTEHPQLVEITGYVSLTLKGLIWVFTSLVMLFLLLKKIPLSPSSPQPS